MKRKTIIIAVALVSLVIAAGVFATKRWTAVPQPNHPLVADGRQVLTVMDFSDPPSLSPLQDGWWHRRFFMQAPMKISFVNKDAVKALRCETLGSGSIFGRFTDIDVAAYPILKWSWLVEQPVVSDASETDHDGDDHPARLFVKFRVSAAQTRALEIIWSNGEYKRGQWKIIDDFHHYVANGGKAATGENTNTWFSEQVNLLELYRAATGRSDTPRLSGIAIFCDTDDTGARSVAYFGNITLEK